MASTPRGAHRRARFSVAHRTSAMISLAVLTAAGAGALAAPALASAPAAQPATHRPEAARTALAGLRDCSLRLRDGIRAQAGAQQKAADVARRKAAAARKARQAKAKARTEAR